MRVQSRLAAALIFGAAVSAAPDVTAQPAKPPQRVEAGQNDGRVIITSDERADQARERFQRLMEQYPTTLIEVLRRDPSLLHNDAYLVPYPALAAFLNQHPEVGHNPTYFLGSPQRDAYGNSDPASQRISAVRAMFESLTIMLAFMSFFAMLGWVTKAIIDQRRWARASKVQTEAHAKVIDRLSSNEDLLAYIQTPAGQRYLASAPLSVDAAENPISAPFSRILWSVQMGTVAALVGLGFLFVSSRWSADTDWLADFSRMLFLVGVVALAAGLGLVLSALASYMLSRRFGLIQSPTSGHA